MLPLGSLPTACSPQSPGAAAAVSDAVAAAQGCSLSGEVGCSSDGEPSPLIHASEATAAGQGDGPWEGPAAAAAAGGVRGGWEVHCRAAHRHPRCG